MMASRLVPLRFVGYVFVCSFAAVILATPIVSPSRYTHFDTMTAFWLNNSCVFPPITTFQRDILSTDSLVLEPCISGEQDDRTQTDAFTGQLCDTLYTVSKAFCTKTVSKSDIAQDKVNPYVEDERWDVCKDAQTTGKNILLFMTRDRALCERYCLSSATLGPVCRLLVAGVVSYMRSKGEWEASESRSVIATRGRTETGTEKGTSNADVIQNPESRVDIAPRDHPNVEPGVSSGVNQPRPIEGQTEKAVGNVEGSISGVNQPGPIEGQTEKAAGNVEGSISGVNQPGPSVGYRQKDAVNVEGSISGINQLGPIEGKTEKAAGNEEGPIGGVNQPGPGVGYRQKDAGNVEGSISGVNQPGPIEGQTEKAAGNVEGSISGVYQPGPSVGYRQKDAGNEEGSIIGINQPGPIEGKTEKAAGNEEGPIGGVNQPGPRAGYTQEYGDKLEPEASSRVTQSVEQATVEGITEWITNVSNSQHGTVKVLSRVDIGMSETNSKAGDAQERNIGEGGSDKYHNIETNKEAIERGGTVREGTDNHTKASEPKNKDAAENEEEATGSSVPPFGPVEDSDYPSFDEDDDEDPDNIDNEYEDPKFAADDENDNRDFEISSDTKKAKQQPDIPKDGVVKIPKQMDAFEEEEESSGHFMAYFVTAVVLCIAGYVLYHNKQKIIAFVLEGRRDAQRRRTTSSGTAKYTKLQPSVEEVMPSLDKSAATKNFIY